MTSSFDGTAHQRKVASLKNYAARKDLINHLEWRPSKIGHTVYEESDESAFMGIIIGKVAEHKLKVGPSGNYLGAGYGSLSKAKYQLFLTRPIIPALRADFDRAYSLLSQLQDKAAVSRNKRDMITTEGGSNMIRFTKNIFKERENVVRDSPPPVKSKIVYFEDVVGQGKVQPEHDDQDETDEHLDEEQLEEMDEETRHWAVPEKYQTDLDVIKPTHQAEVLPVYDNNQFVEPLDVETTLANSLVEISFTIHHAYIKKGNVEHDTFKAQIEQILLLKKHVTTGISIPNPQQGPIQTHQVFPPSSQSTLTHSTKRVRTDDYQQAGPSSSKRVRMTTKDKKKPSDELATRGRSPDLREETGKGKEKAIDKNEDGNDDEA